MDAILAFFSNLILFTAGVVVCLLWIVIIAAIVVEIWDAFHEQPQQEEEDY